MGSSIRKLSVILMAGFVAGVALAAPAWAKESRAGAAANPWAGYPDPAKLQADHQKVQQDREQIKQHVQSYRQQLSGLKTQRAQAMKAKDKAQANSITQQIQQLKKQATEECQRQRQQLQADRRQFREDVQRQRDEMRRSQAKHPHHHGSMEKQKS